MVPVVPASGKKIVVINRFGGAGSVIADAGSMALFMSDVLEGRVVLKATLRRMTKRLYPIFHSATDQSAPPRYYGLGVMVYRAGGQTDFMLGHTGGLPGASAFVGWSPRHKAIIAVALTGAGSGEFSANELFKVQE